MDIQSAQDQIQELAQSGDPVFARLKITRIGMDNKHAAKTALNALVQLDLQGTSEHIVRLAKTHKECRPDAMMLLLEDQQMGAYSITELAQCSEEDAYKAMSTLLFHPEANTYIPKILRSYPHLTEDMLDYLAPRKDEQALSIIAGIGRQTSDEKTAQRAYDMIKSTGTSASLLNMAEVAAGHDALAAQAVKDIRTAMRTTQFAYEHRDIVCEAVGYIALVAENPPMDEIMDVLAANKSSASAFQLAAIGKHHKALSSRALENVIDVYENGLNAFYKDEALQDIEKSIQDLESVILDENTLEILLPETADAEQNQQTKKHLKTLFTRARDLVYQTVRDRNQGFVAEMQMQSLTRFQPEFTPDDF